MLSKNEAALIRAIAELKSAVTLMDSKVERCVDICEGILDEVAPLGLAIDELSAAAPPPKN